MHTLAPAEQRVAQLLLNDPRTFANLPVAELAQRAEVSKPTVVRFCRSMGYEGLIDFKRKLLGSLSEGVPFIHRNVGARRRCQSSAGESDRQHRGCVFENTATMHPQRWLKKRHKPSLQHSKKANALNFLAWVIRASWRRTDSTSFFRMGFHAVSHSDGHLQIMSASAHGPGRLLGGDL